MSLSIAILAGGLATRLGTITKHTPKVLVEVEGKPFALHQLELLREHGIDHVVFCVGHLGEQIQAVLGNGHRWGMDLRYSFDGPMLLGTGGALQHALPLLSDPFFVLYGDSYLECDYSAVERFFQISGKLGLMTVFRNDNQWDRSNVLYKNGQIQFYDKHNVVPGMRHIDYGLGILRSEIFKNYPEGETLDLALIYRDLLHQNQLAGFEVTNRFYEIGSLDGLRETRQYLIQKNGGRI